MTLVKFNIIAVNAQAVCFEEMNILPASDARPTSCSLFFFSHLCPLTPAAFWGPIRNCHGSITLQIRFQGTVNLRTEEDHLAVLVSPPTLGALHTA